MKLIAIIFILTFIACGNNSERQTENNGAGSDQDTLALEKFIKNTLTTSNNREYIDSANFHIIRGNYVSGSKFIESYENKLTKLDYWKEYHYNGQLKEEGLMTNGHHIYIGVWKYYSITGKLDSMVNHDDKYKISYFKALEIAERKGYKIPNLEVTLTVDKDKTYWQIARWTENMNNSILIAEAILVDTESGKVSKPDYQLLGIY